MTLKPLLEQAPDEFASSLLRSASLDVPSDAHVRRGVLALGAASATLSATATATALAGVGGTALPSTFGVVGLVKWVGIGIGAGLLTSGAGALVADRIAPTVEATAVAAPAPPSPARAPAAATQSTAAPAQPDEAPAPAAREVAAPAPARDAVAAPARAPSAPLASSTTAEAARSLPAGRAALPPLPVAEGSSSSGTSGISGMGPELVALARARQALAARNPTRVLVEIAEYRRTARTRVLDAEAFMLEVEALAQAGRSAEAARRARAYLQAHPGSPHRGRLQELAGRGDR